MSIRAAILLSVLLAITACTDKDTQEQPAASTAVAAPASAPAPVTSVAAPATTDVTTAASTTASAPAVATETAPVPPAAAPSGPGPVLGTDYVVIDTPAVETGKTVSVVEVFNYRCPVCAHFQPSVDVWLKKLPADVKFSTLPAAFGGPWDDFVLAYYAADAMGVRAKTHSEIFKSFHEENKYTIDDIAAAYAKYGVDPKIFAATMQSFAVKAKLSGARAQIATWGVDSIPTLIVAGKYRLKKTVDDDAFLRNADWLVAKVRAERNAH